MEGGNAVNHERSDSTLRKKKYMEGIKGNQVSIKEIPTNQLTVQGSSSDFGELLNANNKVCHKASWTWKGILEGRRVLELGCQKRVGTGESICIWQDLWVPIPSKFKVKSQPCVSRSNATVCDLIDTQTKDWDRSLVEEIFGPSVREGWGKHSKVVGVGAIKCAIEALLNNMGAPFHVAKSNIGRFISTGAVAASWLRESSTLKVLVLQDDRTHPKSRRVSNDLDFQPLPL
ncbi:hypothetical protein ACH5RR_003556 [Cinchona calisaya]|uniref:Smr domain-containing protein n=1 Tax=Cinchona calisaya TaxID=153742 RepID=A0ABD3AV75_9GENT